MNAIVTTRQIRRVVTGHTDAGRSTVLMDAYASNVRKGRTIGHFSTSIWCSDEMPSHNGLGQSIEDMGDRKLGTSPPLNGSRFMIAQFPAGMDSAMHRTDTVDYAIILEGEIAAEFDEGERITLKQHDVLVQRGTNHRWLNESTAPCLIAFVMLDAVPNNVGDPVPRDGIASDYGTKSANRAQTVPTTSDQ
jgi:quercetin dioxygenase-like cupin family protein